MKEFTTIAELASAKTREEIVTWAAEMQKCPYDYEGIAFGEDVCKEGADAEQCNQCWLAALKDVKCKGDEAEEKPKRRTTKKPKEELAAKDSNEGVKALKQLASTMTKKEFMKNIQDNKICPSMYGFPDTMTSCQKHAIGSQCVDCWSTILDSLEFTDVLIAPATVDSAIKEAQTSKETTEEGKAREEAEKQEIIAPTNDPKVLNYVDKLVEEVKKMKAQQVEWDEMLKLKIEKAKAKVEEEKTKLQRAIDFNMAQIKVSFDQLDSKDTKTQKKIKVISGDIILKKATEKIDYDKDKLLAYLKEKGMKEYIKTTEEAKWGEFKKTLAITGGAIVDTATGEAISIDGLSVIIEEEKLEVK